MSDFPEENPHGATTAVIVLGVIGIGALIAYFAYMKASATPEFATNIPSNVKAVVVEETDAGYTVNVSWTAPLNAQAMPQKVKSWEVRTRTVDGMDYKQFGWDATKGSYANLSRKGNNYTVSILMPKTPTLPLFPTPPTQLYFTVRMIGTDDTFYGESKPVLVDLTQSA